MAQPLSVVITDNNGNALTVAGSTILTPAQTVAKSILLSAPESVVLCDVNGNPLQLSGLTNNQTGTTYTILKSDWSKLVTFNNAAATAVTLPQAGTNFPSGWSAMFQNQGIGLVTITPTTSTINGWPQIVLGQMQSVFVYSDGTNYWAEFTKIASTDPASALTAYLTNDAGVGAAQNQIVMQDLSVAGVNTKRKALNIYLETAAQVAGSNYDGLQVNVGATITANTSATAGQVEAAEFSVLASGSAVTLPQINGVKVRNTVVAGTTVTNVVAYLAYLPTIAGTVAQYSGFELDSPGSGAGTVTTWIGINCDLNLNNLGAVTNAFGGVFGAGSKATGAKAAIYLDDSNVDGGSIAFGPGPPTIHCKIYCGTGSPLNVLVANVGSIFLRQDGGAATTLYVKESGSGASTGWVAK